MPFDSLREDTIRAYDPRRDTALGFTPTPEFYSDMANLWSGVRTAADVGGMTSGFGGMAGAFTRLPIKMKKTLEAMARTRSRNVQRPDMAPDLVQEGWESILSPVATKKGTRPAPVEKFSERVDPEYAKLLTAVARNAMRRYIWKNANPVEEPATISKLRAMISRVEQRHLNLTGFAPSDQELGAKLGLKPELVRQYRGSSSLGYSAVPFDPVTGAMSPTDVGGVGRVPQEMTVLPGALAGEFSTPTPRIEAGLRGTIARTDLQKRVLDLYQQGVSQTEIGTTLGVSKQRNAPVP